MASFLIFASILPNISYRFALGNTDKLKLSENYRQLEQAPPCGHSKKNCFIAAKNIRAFVYEEKRKVLCYTQNLINSGLAQNESSECCREDSANYGDEDNKQQLMKGSHALA